MNYTILTLCAVAVALIAVVWRQMRRWPDTVNGKRDGTRRTIVPAIPIDAPPTGRQVG